MLKKKNWFLFLLIFVSVSSFYSCLNFKSLETDSVKSYLAMSKISKLSSGKASENVFLIILENTDYEDALKQPFISRLTKEGALLANYHGISHPSQPNYIALMTGDTHGVVDDNSVTLDVPHLGDLLESSGKSWKAYAEGFPGHCFQGDSAGTYFRKHLPFISFLNVQQISANCAKISNEQSFQNDAKIGSLPNFSLYIPDIKNDGHDTGIEYADRWLGRFFDSNLAVSKILENTLFIITFDEGLRTADNHIATILVGPGIRSGALSNQVYNHYNLLKTIEHVLNLPSLGKQDQKANLIDDIWE